MARLMRPGISRWLLGVLASVLLVAAVSGLVALLEPVVPPLYLLVLYVLVVLAIAIVWGTRLAAVASVLSAAVFAFLFVPPDSRFEPAGWWGTAALGVFLVTAAVAGELGRAVGASITVVLRPEEDGTATVVGGWAEPQVLIPAGARLTVTAQGVPGPVVQPGVTVRTERFAGPPGSVGGFFQQAGASTGLASPIVVEGRVWGVAVAGSRAARPFPAGSGPRIAEFTALAATAISNAEAQAQLRDSRARVVASADEARRRIERDLHDGAQQRLVTLALQLRMTQAVVPADLADLGADLERVSAGLTSALDDCASTPAASIPPCSPSAAWTRR